MLLTSLVGGDSDGHTLGTTCATGLGDPVACVDDESVVHVCPELAHYDSSSLQASLARREEHVCATGNAELRVGV